MGLSDYVAGVTNAANTILEGMAVTFSYLVREPITVQYPDKTARPVAQTLPQRYRGLLEVQMDICTGCKRCERACPIDVIAIDLTKDPATKKPAMSRFDIDLGKCMFCGLCVEACLQEATGALRHTREFEGASDSLDAMVYRFIPEGLVPLYRAPKDASEIPVGEFGPHAREARERAARDNPSAFDDLRTRASENAATAESSSAASPQVMSNAQVEPPAAEPPAPALREKPQPAKAEPGA